MKKKTYLELSEEGEGSHKFYEVLVDNREVSIRFGRIGTQGRLEKKNFPSPEKAQAHASSKINSKKKKGYEEAVMGVRKKRPITRRAIQSRRSSAKQAPVIWKYRTGRAAFGIFVDENNCWVGNEAGRVFQLDHEGALQNQYSLPNGVKCLVSDGDWLYAGCDDGNVYDLNGKKPYVAYEIAPDVDIYWLDIFDGVLGVADENGWLYAFNHEDESSWKKKSKGTSGWMVRCDEVGIYHGHSSGVTMYDWEDGSRIWDKKSKGAVLFGWQDDATVYAGTRGNRVQRFDKRGRMLVECVTDASVYSCAASPEGEFIFAGDNCSSVYCFNNKGERLWKLATGCGSAFSMQYRNERLYIVTTDGSMTCIDASPAAIEKARKGDVPSVREIQAPKKSGVSASSSYEQLDKVTRANGGVILECVESGGRPRVRVRSRGYEQNWNVQFPKNLRKVGAKYVVDEVRESVRGGFYRALGTIRRMER